MNNRHYNLWDYRHLPLRLFALCSSHSPISSRLLSSWLRAQSAWADTNLLAWCIVTFCGIFVYHAAVHSPSIGPWHFELCGEKRKSSFNKRVWMCVCVCVMKCPHLKPARTLSSVLLPAPDGPKIAVNWLDLNCPFIPRRITFFPERSIQSSSAVHYNSLKV